MSDRSDEVTESRDPDELLEETESLLSEPGVGTDTAPRGPGDRSTAERDVGAVDETASTPAAPDASRSRLGSLRDRLTPDLSLGDYFSPRGFLALVLLVGAGLFGGGTAIPLPGGRMLGMFAVAFAVGLLGSRRRYLEMAAAGTVVGGLSAVASHTVIAVAGSVQAVVAVGVAAGLIGCLLGYYFGRDLRNGLSADIE